MTPSVSVEPPSHLRTSGWTLPWRGKMDQKAAQPNAIQAKPMAISDAAIRMACSSGPAGGSADRAVRLTSAAYSSLNMETP